jgi:transcription antitermination factor NusG
MSNAEFSVEDALTSYGIESFLPTWVERTQWSDREKSIRRPLFPGYLFALCAGGPRRELLRIAGVIQTLPTSLNPLPIDASEIDNVRLALRSALPVKPCDYISGDAVVIERGPLAGVKGIVLRTKQGTRVIVRIEMLQRAVSVEVDAEDVMKEAA